MTKINHRISTCLWFENQEGEEAAKFYTSIFPNSKIDYIAKYGDAAAQASGQPKGAVMTVKFTLDGHEFLALNGGPWAKHSPATSFMVACDTQEEIDHYWEKLSKGGKTSQCGWLHDKFGVTWQVYHAEMDKMMTTGDSAAAERAMAAVMTMTKLDLQAIRDAYNGKPAKAKS